MKFFKINYWLTLVELVISIGISTVIFLWVFSFMSEWLIQIDDSNNKTKIVDQVFSFNYELNKFIRWWYTTYSKIWTSNNSVLLLKNIENSKWLIFWVVNKDDMKLQENYIYWNNIIWYRYLSEQEVVDVEADESKIYTLKFQKDKLFDLILVKDFNIEFYNSDEIIDLYLSTFTFNNIKQYWKSLTWFYLGSWDLLEFNFNF